MIVFFDIDGTLIDESTQIIPESAVDAIHALQKNGHIAVINTGRPFSHIDSRIRRIAFRGYVCACGMELLLDDQWIVHEYPGRALRDRIISASRCYHMNSFYELADGGLMADDFTNCPTFMTPELVRMQERGFPLLETDRCDDPQFLKLVTFLQPGSNVDGFISALSEDMEITDRGEGMYELVMHGYSKAKGIQRMAEHLGFSPDDTLAIGDSTNDLPMLQYARHSVCMGNGMTIVKQSCEYVTDSVLNDGIAKALKHYELI